jgi:hypothetical protein
MPAKKKPGRPPMEPEELKHKISVALTQPSIDWLDAVTKKTRISRSAILENYVRIQIEMNGGDPSKAAQTSDN